MIVPFETIMLFSKAILGEFNIAGGDSHLFSSVGIEANFTNLIYAFASYQQVT
jgi:hypothetical protein